MRASSIDPVSQPDNRCRQRGFQRSVREFNRAYREPEAARALRLERRVFLAPMQLQADLVGAVLLATTLGDPLALGPVGDGLLGLLQLGKGFHDLVAQLVELCGEVRDR